MINQFKSNLEMGESFQLLSKVQATFIQVTLSMVKKYVK